MDLTATTTVRKPVAEVYAYRRDLENLPAFMGHLDEVRRTGERTSHWTAGAPFGRTVEWDAEIVTEVPGERLAWRSAGEADVPNTGEVRLVTRLRGANAPVTSSRSAPRSL
ncbi:SRPBCC family protein [Sphaerisporangium sp. B11E5]|uniref:SRPBCC family protein n=1 Tax=Sphaerisporangium sp. B11E5 TaxID=3153563 RepID=UPI00325D7560